MPIWIKRAFGLIGVVINHMFACACMFCAGVFAWDGQWMNAFILLCGYFMGAVLGLMAWEWTKDLKGGIDA